MKILAIDTSSKICSVSILENKKIIIEKHNDDEKTHSQKLMPLIDSIFKESNLQLDDIDLLACSQGPGSFTGIRIGISTVKAFADVKHIPIIGVTSLEALAYNINQTDTPIVTMIDAKNDNVYFSLFELKDHKYNQIIEPTAENIYNVIDILKKYNSNKIKFVGDGSITHKNLLNEHIHNCSFSSDEENLQTSISVGLSAFDKFNLPSYIPCYSVSPIYLKKCQAELNLSSTGQP